MPLALGALAQEGGVAVDNLTAQMPDRDWAVLAKEFFLSRSYSEFAGPRALAYDLLKTGCSDSDRAAGSFGEGASHPQVRARARPIQLTRPKAVGNRMCSPRPARRRRSISAAS